MNGLNAKYSSFPSLAELYSTIEELCLELVQQDEGTILNSLLGCGEGIQFAFSWPAGSRSGSNTPWNGLFYKVDDDSKCSGMVVEDGNTSSKEEEENGQVAIIATQPLTNDDESSWVEFMRGDLLLYYYGQVFTSHTDLCQYFFLIPTKMIMKPGFEGTIDPDCRMITELVAKLVCKQ
jgi:hypothetical protein